MTASLPRRRSALFGALDQAEVRELCYLLNRHYRRVRVANGGLFAADDPHLAALAGDLFDLLVTDVLPLVDVQPVPLPEPGPADYAQHRPGRTQP